MDLNELLPRFAVALGIGLIVGLERGWRQRTQQEGSRAAGIRTFSITGLLGGVVGALVALAGGAASAGGGIILGLGLATYAAVITVFCRDENQAEKIFSATTVIAAMATFALGAYSVLGDMRIAAALGVVIAGLLAMRQSMHGWVAQITWPELRSGLVLLAMTFVALPMIPNDPIGPFGGVNPREVWLIAIVLAAVSFLGYATVKSFGVRRGVLLAAAAGGLASSTAVTLENARRARAGEGDPLLLAAGVALATAVSFARVMAIVAALAPSLLQFLSAPLIGASLVALLFAAIAVRWMPGRKSAQRLSLRNPFRFWSVVGFALMLSAIILIGQALSQWTGAAGVVWGAAALGVADLDAVTVSMARLSQQSLGAIASSLAILVAVASNNATKMAIGASVGGGRFAALIAAMSVACIAAGGLAFWLMQGLSAAP